MGLGTSGHLEKLLGEARGLVALRQFLQRFVDCGLVNGGGAPICGRQHKGLKLSEVFRCLLDSRFLALLEDGVPSRHGVRLQDSNQLR